jgi:large subunit ribosomal protein L33
MRRGGGERQGKGAGGEGRQADFLQLHRGGGAASLSGSTQESTMPRELICLECSEARKEGKSPSRYYSTRNKRTKQEKVEKLKYNKFLRRHTIHKEVKM